jgi:hypothetical protein
MPGDALSARQEVLVSEGEGVLSLATVASRLASARMVQLSAVSRAASNASALACEVTSIKAALDAVVKATVDIISAVPSPLLPTVSPQLDKALSRHNDTSSHTSQQS